MREDASQNSGAVPIRNCAACLHFTMTLSLRYGCGILLLLAALLTVLNRFWGCVVVEDKVILHATLFAGMWAVVGLVVLYSRVIERGPFLLWTETGRGWKFHLLSLLAVFAATILLGILNRAIGGAPNTEQAAKDMAYWDAHPWLFLFMGLTAGCTEELLMRGYLQPRLQLLTRSTWTAILVSAAIFSLAHYTNSPPPKLVLLFVQGALFAWHYRRYRSLVALMVAHVLIDVVRM